MNRRTMRLVMAWIALVSVSAGAREIFLPTEGALAGNVLIAEAFTHVVAGEVVPFEFAAWPGSKGVKPSTWFTVRVEAHPGDVIVLAPGEYEAQIWIFSPGVTVRTDPTATGLALIRGTIEVDADGVTLERLAVTTSSDATTSGHGIEVNRDRVRSITVRDCSSSGNRWTGIHIIGTAGTIDVMRVERCVLQGNGMDGMDATSMGLLIVTGCTITGNGWGLSTGVGIRIGHFVRDVQLTGNVVEDNRFADVYRAPG